MNRFRLPLQLVRPRYKPLTSLHSQYPFRTLTMSGNNPPEALNGQPFKPRYIDVPYLPYTPPKRTNKHIANQEKTA